MNQQLERIKLGYTKEEYSKYLFYLNKHLSRLKTNNQKKTLEEELKMGISRDIQAQRLPPNTQIPSRKHPIEYFHKIFETLKKTNQTTSQATINTFMSYLSPTTWTSSGGTHKYAQILGYNLAQELISAKNKFGDAHFLEIGAGYAGFKSKTDLVGIKGLRKILDEDKSNSTIQLNFTNLTQWHNQKELPNSVREFAGYCGRDILELREKGIPKLDLIYGQCSLQFEPELFQFLKSSAQLLRNEGLLIFNTNPNQKEEINGNSFSKKQIIDCGTK